MDHIVRLARLVQHNTHSSSLMVRVLMHVGRIHLFFFQASEHFLAQIILANATHDPALSPQTVT